MTTENAVAQRSSLRDHPLGFWFIFWGEFSERSCYYGMRAILLLYMVERLGFTDQSASTWTLFARDHLDLNIFTYEPGTWHHGCLEWTRDRVGLDLLGKRLPPDLLQSINPLLILLLLPPITLLWHLLPRLGINLRPTDKMLIGFVLTGCTMAIMSVAGYRAAELGRVSVLWEVVSYILITVAEICISVVGLELAFTAAPATMKSFVTACFLLTVFVGNILNAQITPLYGAKLEWLGLTMTPGLYFGLFALGTIPVAVAFLLIARRFNRSAQAQT